MDEELVKSARKVTITDNPLVTLAVGTKIQFEPIVFGGSNSTRIPQGANDWTFFDGALLAVVINTAINQTVVGTAVIIAPGLAISASHIISEHLTEIMEGALGLSCFGPTVNGLDFWRVRKVSTSIDSDIVYLSLELSSPISDDWRFRTVSLTTRTPKVGEKISVVGFRFPHIYRNSENEIHAHGELFIASGDVCNVYHPIRDRLLMPYPAIEISCGSLGGMSGGAVLDEDGFLLGVISRSFDTEDQCGPTYASWILGALNRKLDIVWPPGLYSQPVHLLDIDARAIRIDGRNYVSVKNDNSLSYQIWFDR